jgi:hypothetical protein
VKPTSSSPEKSWTRAPRRRHPRQAVPRRRGATLTLGYGGRWQLLRCVDPGRSLEVSRVMGAHMWSCGPPHIDLSLVTLLQVGAISGGSRPAFTPCGQGQRAQGQRRRNGDEVLWCLPAPKGHKDPGTRAPWVRPTSPPAAPSGQRATDLRRPGASSCCAPRARPRSLEDQSGARPQAPLPLTPSRGMFAIWTGGH